MTIKTLSVTLLLGSLPLLATTGESLFDDKCMACHMKEKPTPQTRGTMVAPPAMGVMFHVKQAFGTDKEAALAFVKEYVMEPSAEKAKCLPRSIQRFGVMPSMKGTLSEEELALIAEYLYENYPPQGFVHGGGPAQQ